jgi:enterochelin esterase family protein
LWVYTPPGYDSRDARRYPVLYLLHGAGDGAHAWSLTGRVNLVMDSLLAMGAAEPMIVVMPLGYGFPDAASRAGEMFSPATNQRTVMDAFSASLLDEIVPLIEREYRVRPDRESRAIAGLSMGGSQALYIGLNRRDVFSQVASFGAAVIMYGGRYAEWFPGIAAGGFHPESKGDATLAQSLHMSVGTDDFLRGANRHFVSWLTSHDATVQLDEVSGAHTWHVWRSEVTRLVPRLFRADSGTSLSLDQEIR